MRELIFGLIGGTALLMYSIEMMGDGLEKVSGPMMKKILGALTGNALKSTFVGMLLTALVQSSTAVTVLTVGFVNAGLMKFSQAVGIIYGANIGTTITAQLMALSFSFKLTDVALPVLGAGFAIIYFSRRDHIKHLGSAIMGFGMMFYGLKILNAGAPIMQTSETLRFFFTHYASIPLVGVLLGIVATAMVHSSAATVALVMVLGTTGMIDFPTAIYLTLGDNIGTCVTAQIASMAGNISARRTAWAHTLYNMVGVVLVFFFVPQYAALVKSVTFAYQPAAGMDILIANTHTIFNVASALIFLPFTKYFVRFLETVVKQKAGQDWDDDDDSKVMDRLLLNTPVAAVDAAKKVINISALRSKSMLEQTMVFIYEGKMSLLDEVNRSEQKLNAAQRNLTRYMVQLSKGSLTGIPPSIIPALITCMNHVERTGDHARDLVELAQIKVDRHLSFSDQALLDLKDLEKLVLDMYGFLAELLLNPKKTEENFLRLRDMEDAVDVKAKTLLDGHVLRLEEGLCTVEAGVYFMDIVNFLERISDHIFKAAKDLRAGEAGIGKNAKPGSKLS
ncbi:MAG: Na/Pi cotransporter family protein [Peptococcaceae bacterium]|jgi:phosphate:Na+ symporter|nr:Na/Pi cotransporter family protein [Peptococcaceae bacterium]